MNIIIICIIFNIPKLIWIFQENVIYFFNISEKELKLLRFIIKVVKYTNIIKNHRIGKSIMNEAEFTYVNKFTWKKNILLPYTYIILYMFTINFFCGFQNSLKKLLRNLLIVRCLYQTTFYVIRGTFEFSNCCVKRYD